MEKLFNYQVVFRLSDDCVVVFTGKTPNSYFEVVEGCKNALSYERITDRNIENIVYQPFKEENNEK